MATGEDVKAALDHWGSVTAMMRDPDLQVDALLFAIALLHVRDSRRAAERGTKNWIVEIQELVGKGAGWVKRTIGNDVPRYEPPRESDAFLCQSPMIRREGVCGQRGYPDDGSTQYYSECSRHRGWMRSLIDKNRREWLAAGSPQPAANTGGVLARYFNADWPRAYEWAAPWRKVAKAPPPTPPRPTLRLITGGIADGTP